MITTILLTAMFCLGFHLVTTDNYAFSFIRKFFERNEQLLEALDFNKGWYTGKPLLYRFLYIKRYLFTLIANPVCMCITCMGSIWGVLIYVTLHGFHFYDIPFMIINCCAAAFLQTYIWKHYVKNIL